MKRLLRSASALSLLFAGSAAAAPVTIDTFATPAVPLVFIGPSAAPSAGPTSGPGIFSVRSLSTSGPLALGDVVALGGGSFQQFTGTSSIQSGLVYSFPALQDFSGDLGVEFRFLFLDGGATSSTTEFNVALNTGGGGLTASFTHADSAVPFTTVVPFSSFVGGGNLGTVIGASFSFNGVGSTQVGTDFVLDNLAVVARPAAVPEPSSIPLTALGLLGAAAAWYRRRRS